MGVHLVALKVFLQKGAGWHSALKTHTFEKNSFRSLIFFYDTLFGKSKSLIRLSLMYARHTSAFHNISSYRGNIDLLLQPGCSCEEGTS